MARGVDGSGLHRADPKQHAVGKRHESPGRRRADAGFLPMWQWLRVAPSGGPATSGRSFSSSADQGATGLCQLMPVNRAKSVSALII